ncbi:MAG TPA: sugar transferase [Pseudonocardiaceae bacterium]|jgi:exopolysaccharide biosynthesis polyprenyl glycosylphosphotransferase
MSEQVQPAHRGEPRHFSGQYNDAGPHYVPGHARLTPTPTGQHAQPTVASWERQYRFAVIGSDLVAIGLALLVAATLLGKHVNVDGPYRLLISAIVTVVVVCGALMASRSWRANVLGQGAEEFRRLGRALVTAAVILALVSLAVGDGNGRPWVFLVIPTIAILAMPQRYLLRRFLHRARGEGRCLLPVLAAGSTETVHDLIMRTRQTPHLGWRVEAVCTVDGRAGVGTRIAGVPVIGQLADLAQHVRRGGYRIVGVTADQYWTPRRLQQLAWDLEGSTAEMVVAPVLMEVAGPRVHVSGVLGMPLLRVSAPVFTGVRRVIKEIFDRVAASLLLLVMSPALVVFAALIKATSRGPVFYRQRRVGKDGKPFTMIKFRTMVVGADAKHIQLRLTNDGAGPLFKMRSDPRITKIGSWLRRYSADELPQLLNVVGGTMSLVGPRPPLPEETMSYGPDVKRRLLVRPGMTGLWQVSGRSDLSWDESVRLDLRYVEDWSLALDALILWKTVRAVFTGAGAY